MKLEFKNDLDKLKKDKIEEIYNTIYKAHNEDLETTQSKVYRLDDFIDSNQALRDMVNDLVIIKSAYNFKDLSDNFEEFKAGDLIILTDYKEVVEEIIEELYEYGESLEEI